MLKISAFILGAVAMLGFMFAGSCNENSADTELHNRTVERIKIVEVKIDTVYVKLDSISGEVKEVRNAQDDMRLSLDSLKRGQRVIYDHITKKSQKAETKEDSYSNELKKFFE